MKQQKTPRLSPFFSMALFTLLLACILFLVVLGSNLYRSLTESRQQNNAARTGLRYLSTTVHSADRENAVQILPGPEGDALILKDADNGYETRIYLSEGMLMEELSSSGSPFSPESAQPIGSCTQFELSFHTPQLLCIKTSEGTV